MLKYKSDAPAAMPSAISKTTYDKDDSQRVDEILYSHGLTKLDFGKSSQSKLYGYIDVNEELEKKLDQEFKRALEVGRTKIKKLDEVKGNIFELRSNNDPRILGAIYSNKDRVKELLRSKDVKEHEIEMVAQQNISIICFEKLCLKHEDINKYANKLLHKENERDGDFAKKKKESLTSNFAHRVVADRAKSIDAKSSGHHK